MSTIFDWSDLGVSPVAFFVGPVPIRWYALSFLAMLGLGWWYLRALVRRPGAPMSAANVDDLLSYIAFGVIVGGRLGYTLVYRPQIWRDPLDVLKVWEGGMSFHGGLAGVLVAMWLFARRNGLSFIRICDYVACATPFGLVLVRVANFVNGELWGRPTGAAWGVVFPGAGDGIPRHPSQLYEAAFEGLLMMAVLSLLFWRTDARERPGRLTGIGLLIYGLARFSLEAFRQPDRGLEQLPWGLTMGQTLTIPILAGGVFVTVRSFSTRAAHGQATA